MSERRTWRGPAPDHIAAWQLVQAGHAVGRRFWNALSEVGLTPVQFGVLLELDRQPGQSNAAIARTVLVTPQSMSELLNGLVVEGLVERDPAPRGQRVTTRLTTNGRRRLRQCEDVVDRVEASLGLDPPQVSELGALLRQVIASPAPDA